jgi:hypothetical protein
LAPGALTSPVANPVPNAAKAPEPERLPRPAHPARPEMAAAGSSAVHSVSSDSLRPAGLDSRNKVWVFLALAVLFALGAAVLLLR